MESGTCCFIILFSLLLFLIAVFLLTGLIFVKKGEFVLLSKNGHFQKALTKGVYYFLPLFYQTSNPLPADFIEKKLILDGKHALLFSWRLVDPKKYFSSHLKMKRVLRDIFKESRQNPSLTKEMSQVLTNLGIEVKNASLIER